MSKYTKLVLEILASNKMKSTNEILKELEAKTKKVINWHNLYRILMELKAEDKVDRIETKAGFFWKRL